MDTNVGQVETLMTLFALGCALALYFVSISSSTLWQLQRTHEPFKRISDSPLNTGLEDRYQPTTLG